VGGCGSRGDGADVPVEGGGRGVMRREVEEEEEEEEENVYITQ